MAFLLIRTTTHKPYSWENVLEKVPELENIFLLFSSSQRGLSRGNLDLSLRTQDLGALPQSLSRGSFPTGHLLRTSWMFTTPLPWKVEGSSTLEVFEENCVPPPPLPMAGPVCHSLRDLKHFLPQKLGSLPQKINMRLTKFHFLLRVANVHGVTQ